MGDDQPSTKASISAADDLRPVTPQLLEVTEDTELLKLTQDEGLERGSRSAEASSKSGVLLELWDSKAWRVYPMMLLYVSGMTALGPLTPTLMTNFFASRAAGEELQCQHLQPQPPECVDAHSEAVTWNSWTAFVSNSLLSCMMMPLVGDFSDVYGRRPFMAAAILLAALPVIVMLLYINVGTSLLWYFPASALQGCASSVSISLALLADVLTPAARGPAFGGLMASFSLGIMIGPTIGGIIMYRVADGINVAAWVALATCLICVLYVLLALPDTTRPGAQAKARRRMSRDKHMLQSSWRAAKILMRSSLFKKLTVCLMLSGAVAEGMMDLLLQYLQLVANFQPSDQMGVFVVYGAAALAVQAILLPWMLVMFKERRVLTIGLAASLLQQLLLAMVHTKWAGYTAVVFGSLGSVAFPAISSIKSTHAREDEQGAVQGALYGSRALAMGLGPLAFAGVFRAFTKTGSGLPYMPGAPFLLGAAGIAAALVCSASIERDAAVAVEPQVVDDCDSSSTSRVQGRAASSGAAAAATNDEGAQLLRAA